MSTPRLADALVAIDFVIAAEDVSEATVGRRVADELLPEPIYIGKRCKRWFFGELQQVRQARAAGANDEAIRRLVRTIMAGRRLAA